VLASVIWGVFEMALCVQVSETLEIESTSAVPAHAILGNSMTPALGYHWRYAMLCYAMLPQLGGQAQSKLISNLSEEASRKLEATNVLNPHPPFVPLQIQFQSFITFCESLACL